MENNINSHSQDIQFLHARLQRQEVTIAQLNGWLAEKIKEKSEAESKAELAKDRISTLGRHLRKQKEKNAVLRSELQEVSEENLNRSQAMHQMKEELARKQIEIEDLKNQLDRSEARVIEFNTVPSNNPLLAS